MRFERVFMQLMCREGVPTTNDQRRLRKQIVKSQMCALANYPRALPFALDDILGGNV